MSIAVLLLALSVSAEYTRENASVRTDTLRLVVGSAEVDGRIFPVHRARNSVYGPGKTTPGVTWTNELTLGDSAGRQVMRWVTRGTLPNGATWELLQTYDARTLAPLAYFSSSSNGAQKRLRIDGTSVRGFTKAPGDSVAQVVDMTLSRAGFIASASDLVPLAVGLREGVVMIAPVWGPEMAEAEDRVFTVLEQQTVEVEGENILAWKVEERVYATKQLKAIWYLTEQSPYMVLAEIPLPNGGIQRITGVALD